MRILCGKYLRLSVRTEMGYEYYDIGERVNRWGCIVLLRMPCIDDA